MNEQLRACRKWRRNSLEKVPTIRAKAEEDLDAWSLAMPCLMPHLQLPAQNIF